MAADLGLVVHAAEADANERPRHRARDRLAQRGLADAGRPDEAQDRRLAAGRELAHRQVLDDAALDLLQAVMVLVEDLAGLGDVDRLLLGHAPGQLDQPVQIAAHHAGLGGGLRHPLVAAQLLLRLAVRLRRHLGLRDRLGQLGDLLRPCRRLRRAGAGWSPSARAGSPRAAARRTRPWSSGRSPGSGAAPRCARRDAATPSPSAAPGRWSRGCPASPAA